MKSRLTKFEIKGLFGYKNVSIDFAKPYLILVGENGSGKTTILNILSFIFEKKWIRLYKQFFTEIKITFGEKTYKINHKIISQYLYNSVTNEYKSSEILSIPRQSYFNLLNRRYHNIPFDEWLDNWSIEDYPELWDDIKSNVDISLPKESAEKENVINKLNVEIDAFNSEVLFLTTFRRIESNFSDHINKHLIGQPTTEARKQLENIKKLGLHLGMDDVEKLINETLGSIKDECLKGFNIFIADYIKNLLNDRENPISQVDQEYGKRITLMSKRLFKFLDNDYKELLEKVTEIKTLDGNDPKSWFIISFMDGLYNLYKKQAPYDTAVKNFVEVCNSYLIGKKFEYNEEEIKLEIFTDSKRKKQIKLSNLSSGEQQIVSLFAQLYLIPKKRYIVLFDEPELSLSIPWQEKLLPDILDTDKISLMIVATHSPFIFNNKTEEYTHGLSEFTK